MAMEGQQLDRRKCQSLCSDGIVQHHETFPSFSRYTYSINIYSILNAVSCLVDPAILTVTFFYTFYSQILKYLVHERRFRVLWNFALLHAKTKYLHILYSLSTS